MLITPDILDLLCQSALSASDLARLANTLVNTPGLATRLHALFKKGLTRHATYEAHINLRQNLYALFCLLLDTQALPLDTLEVCRADAQTILPYIFLLHMLYAHPLIAQYAPVQEYHRRTLETYEVQDPKIILLDLTLEDSMVATIRMYPRLWYRAYKVLSAVQTLLHNPLARRASAPVWTNDIGLTPGHIKCLSAQEWADIASGPWPMEPIFFDPDNMPIIPTAIRAHLAATGSPSLRSALFKSLMPIL